jgi:endonuclease YncB( thermonuclease family)
MSALAAVSGVLVLFAGPASASRLVTKAEVESVTDGDTIRATVHGESEPVRFIGIDTPEVPPVNDCGGVEASNSMKRMLEPGDTVRLVRDPSQGNRDIYDRLLRYVEFNGKDLGRKQVSRGWAETFVYDRPFDRVSSYRKKQKQARRHDRGVWGMCPGNFPPP